MEEARCAGNSGCFGSDGDEYDTVSGYRTAGIVQAVSTMEAGAYATANVVGSQATVVAAANEQAQVVYPEWQDRLMANVDEFLYVRATASTDSDIVGKMYKGDVAEVTAPEGDWYQITSGNCTGYVKCEFVVVGDEELAKSVSTRLATVTTQTLYVREQPTTESSVEGMVPEGDDLVVTDESMADTGWVKVSLLDYEGYVSLEFVTLSTDYVTAESKEEEEARLAKEEAERKAAAAAAAASSRKSSGGSYYTGGSSSYASPSGSGGSAVVGYASQFVGNPYVYGVL